MNRETENSEIFSTKLLEVEGGQTRSVEDITPSSTSSTSDTDSSSTKTSTSEEECGSYSIPVVITDVPPKTSRRSSETRHKKQIKGIKELPKIVTTPKSPLGGIKDIHGVGIGMPPKPSQITGTSSQERLITGTNSQERLIISPRLTNSDPSSRYLSPRSGLTSSDESKNNSSGSPRKILNLKNHIVEIQSDQPLNMIEQEAVAQFISPRLEQSPRVFESRMIELQMQYERLNAHLTKMVEKKSEEITAQAAKINELSTQNEELRNINFELTNQFELSKKSQSFTKIDQDNVIECLTQKLTKLAIENMELRINKDKIHGGSIVYEDSIQLLNELKKDENIAVLKSDLFDLKQKQLSYDHSVELYEQEIRKVIKSAKHSIQKEKDKRKQMEQEINFLQGKIRELEFFIIEELADVSESDVQITYDVDET